MGYQETSIVLLEEIITNCDELLECASAGGNKQQVFDLCVDRDELDKIEKQISSLMTRVSKETAKLDGDWGES